MNTLDTIIVNRVGITENDNSSFASNPIVQGINTMIKVRNHLEEDTILFVEAQ
jgi:hypothetical protein